MKSFRSFCWLLALAAGVALPAAAQKTELLVYTALETDQLKAYEEGFKKTNPNIDLKWVRDSTGVITAKLLAEKSNPKADVVMGVAATSMKALGFRSFLDPSIQAPIIYTFHAPADAAYEFKRFYAECRDRGFILYPGKLTQVETFRVGCIGAIGRAEIGQAVDAIGHALDEMGLQLPTD